MAKPHTDRRRLARASCAGLTATVRERGRLVRCRGEALDFNRYGVAVQIDRPMAKDTTVFVALAFGDAKVDALVGVVHNCRPMAGGGFRCGIQFRLNSPMQLDRALMIASLVELEDLIAETNRAPRPSARARS